MIAMPVSRDYRLDRTFDSKVFYKLINNFWLGGVHEEAIVDVTCVDVVTMVVLKHWNENYREVWHSTCEKCQYLQQIVNSILQRKFTLF